MAEGPPREQEPESGDDTADALAQARDGATDPDGAGGFWVASRRRADPAADPGGTGATGVPGVPRVATTGGSRASGLSGTVPAPTAPVASVPLVAPERSAPASPAAAAAAAAAADAAADADVAPATGAAASTSARDPLAVLTELVPVPPPSSPPAARVAPPARRPRRRPGFWRYGFPAVLVACTILIPVLAYAGRKTVLQSTDGVLLTEVTDPNAPGWQAITEPTPTLLLVQVDAANVPNGLTVLSLTGEGAGGLIFVPMTTVLELADLGMIPLNAAAARGVDALRTGVEGVLGAGMDEVQIVSPQQWADLATPVGPLTIDNPDAVTVAEPDAEGKTVERILFAKGTITVAPAEVAAYLATTSPGENDLNRLVRHKAFWDAWLRKVGASNDPAVVPGEVETGLGRFVRALGRDRVEKFPLPVQGAGIPGTTATVYVPIEAQVRSLVARLVPFPVGAPPGARPRLRVLDGTGKLDHGLRAVGLLVEGGGQIDQIGNARSFDVAATELVYYDEARRAEVERLRDALGLGTLVKGTDLSGAVDVTVTLGADFLAAPVKPLAPVSTAPSADATTTIVGVSGGD